LSVHVADIVFMGVFGFLFGFQFVAMLFHRGHTFMHYVGRAEHVPGWHPFARRQAPENSGAGERPAGDHQEQVNNTDNVAAGSQQTDIEDQQEEVNRMDDVAAGSRQPETGVRRLTL
jgi:hypothetical protein